MIYKHVLGGNFLHTNSHKNAKGQTKYYNNICVAKISEAEAEAKFHDPENSSVWYVEDGVDRHSSCSDTPAAGVDGYPRLSTALLRVCRQIYSEAEHVAYSANTFSFDRPEVLILFQEWLKKENPRQILALRNLHLHIFFEIGIDGRLWNDAIVRSARQLRDLQRIHISIDQGHREVQKVLVPYVHGLVFIDSFRLDLLFVNLENFGMLPLKTATCVVSDKGIEERWQLNRLGTIFFHAYERIYRWTLGQKRARAKSLTEAILRPGRGEESEGIHGTLAPESVLLWETAVVLRDADKK